MQQYFVNPGLQLDYFSLNTHRPLFSDVRMRQAVNYAIDRRALAQLGDAYEPLPEPPTDHYLPPGMPGFRDTHVYPMTPDLRWTRLSRGMSKFLLFMVVAGAGVGRPSRRQRRLSL
jgi:peptide/nickel transport system substrate-binding protein